MANSVVSNNKRNASSQNRGNKRMKVSDEEKGVTGQTRNEVNFQREMLDKLEEELKCNICTEILIKPTVLNCSHTFCEYCIVKWKKQQGRCPICRDRIESQISVLALNVYIEKAIELLSPEQSKARNEIIKEREKANCPKPRRSPRLRNRPCITNHEAAFAESSFHLRALIEEVLQIANHFEYD